MCLFPTASHPKAAPAPPPPSIPGNSARGLAGEGAPAEMLSPRPAPGRRAPLVPSETADRDVLPLAGRRGWLTAQRRCVWKGLTWLLLSSFRWRRLRRQPGRPSAFLTRPWTDGIVLARRPRRREDWRGSSLRSCAHVQRRPGDRAPPCGPRCAGPGMQ